MIENTLRKVRRVRVDRYDQKLMIQFKEENTIVLHRPLRVHRCKKNTYALLCAP